MVDSKTPTPQASETKSHQCCGGPAAEGIDACCVSDAEAKAAGKGGCGCSETDNTNRPAAQ